VAIYGARCSIKSDVLYSSIGMVILNLAHLCLTTDKSKYWITVLIYMPRCEVFANRTDGFA